MENEIEQVIVTGCGDCPMYGDSMVDYCIEKACYHLSNSNTGDDPFETCPLKEKAITITLKQ